MNAKLKGDMIAEQAALEVRLASAFGSGLPIEEAQKLSVSSLMHWIYDLDNDMLQRTMPHLLRRCFHYTRRPSSESFLSLEIWLVERVLGESWDNSEEFTAAQRMVVADSLDYLHERDFSIGGVLPYRHAAERWRRGPEKRLRRE